MRCQTTISRWSNANILSGQKQEFLSVSSQPSIQRQTRPLCKPLTVIQAQPGRVRAELRPWAMRLRDILHGYDGARPAFPLVDLRMPVGEGDATGAIVIRGRQIIPRAASQSRIDLKPAVVDAVGLFIQNHKQFGWGTELGS